MGKEAEKAVQPSMFTSEGKVDPKLAAQIARMNIEAQMAQSRQRDLENAQRLAKAQEEAEERGKQHSP